MLQILVLAVQINDYFQITGVQVEVGEKATPFEHRSYGDELARCKRYYQPMAPRQVINFFKDWGCSRLAFQEWKMCFKHDVQCVLNRQLTMTTLVTKRIDFVGR